MVVVANLDEFGAEWSLPSDDLRLWVCLHEVAHHAVLGVPHVRTRLDSLLRRYVAGFEPDPSSLEDRLSGIELTDPSSMAGLSGLQEALGDPEVLLGAIRSPQQLALLPELDALVAVVVGYVDHVMDSVGDGLIGSYRMLSEALRRRPRHRRPVRPVRRASARPRAHPGRLRPRQRVHRRCRRTRGC